MTRPINSTHTVPQVGRGELLLNIAYTSPRKTLPTLCLRRTLSSGRRDGQGPRDLVSGCWSMYSLSQNIAHKFRLMRRVVCNRYIRSSGPGRCVPDDG